VSKGTRRSRKCSGSARRTARPPGSTLLQRVSGAPQIEWSIQKRTQRRGLRVRGKASLSKSCHMARRKFMNRPVAGEIPPPARRRGRTLGGSTARSRLTHQASERLGVEELAQRCQADTYLAVERVGLDASGSIVGNRCGGGAARLAFRLVFEARQEFATESLPGIARECLRPCLPRQAPDCRETDKTLASTQQTTSSSHLSARSTPVSNASRLHLDALADPGEHPST
jgi:hypothetical protein